MNPQRILVGGSAADPPHLGHRAVLKTLIELERFDLVIWILSGFRLDKNINVTADDRVAMTELMLDKTWRIKPGTRLVVKYDDVYGHNTSTITRLKMLQLEYPQSEITWFTGADSVVPRPELNGKCDIEARWEAGGELMANWRFLIIKRRGYLLPSDLPKNFEFLKKNLPDIASSDIRSKIATGQPYKCLVCPKVAEYIRRHNLYG